MLTRLLLYGYATGLTSSRRIEKATHDSVPFRYLAADQHPDHDTIASFRQQHLEPLAKLFVEALELCRRAGLVKPGNVAIDGTKLKASASHHRGRPHAKMSEEERKLSELPKAAPATEIHPPNSRWTCIRESAFPGENKLRRNS